MATDMMDHAPEGLRSLYAEGLGPAPFSVDDIVSGGRRRQRRRAVGAIGAAVAAVAAIGVGATSVWGGASADHRPVQPARTTAPTTYPGCATQPDTCAAVLAAWSREAAGSVAAVRTVSAAKYQEGSPGADAAGQARHQRRVAQSVDVLGGRSPRLPRPRRRTRPRSTGARNLVRLPGLPVAVDRWTVHRTGSAFDRFTVPKGDFARSVAVQVDVTGGAPGGRAVRHGRSRRADADERDADVVDAGQCRRPRHPPLRHRRGRGRPAVGGAGRGGAAAERGVLARPRQVHARAVVHLGPPLPRPDDRRRGLAALRQGPGRERLAGVLPARLHRWHGPGPGDVERGRGRRPVWRRPRRRDR